MPYHEPRNPTLPARCTSARMRRVVFVWFVCIAAALLPGCGEKKTPSEHLRKAAEKLTGVKVSEIERSKEKFEELKVIYELGDFDRLRRACLELDERYNQRILAWYADILYIEHAQGIAAAREAITRLKAQENLSSNESRALDDIEGYFKSKGEMTTAMGAARLLLYVGAIYLEAEYGHGASAPVAALMEMIDRKAQPTAATNASQSIPPETNRQPSPAGSSR